MPQSTDSVFQIDASFVAIDTVVGSIIDDSLEGLPVLDSIPVTVSDSSSEVVSLPILQEKKKDKPAAQEVHSKREEPMPLSDFNPDISFYKTINSTKPLGNFGLLKNNFELPWLLVPFFIILLIFGRIGILNNKRIKQYFNASLSNRFVEVLAREEGVLSPLSSLLLMVYCITGSILLVITFQFFELNQIFYSLKYYGAVLFLVIFMLLLKVALIWFSRLLFGSQQLFNAHRFYFILYTKLLGVLLVFPLIFATFGNGIIKEYALYFALSIYAFMFVLRVSKVLINGFIKSPQNIHYIILYLCSLEIAPVALAFKALHLL